MVSLRLPLLEGREFTHKRFIVSTMIRYKITWWAVGGSEDHLRSPVLAPVVLVAPTYSY